MNTLRELARSNGFRRPSPKLSVTALIRDYFNNHIEKYIGIEDLAMIISSKDPGIDAKSVGRTLWRLSTEKGGYFLATVGRGRGIQYKLAENIKSTPTQVVVKANTVAEMFETVKAQAITKLTALRETKDDEYNKYIQVIQPIVDEIKQLEYLLGERESYSRISGLGE